MGCMLALHCWKVCRSWGNFEAVQTQDWTGKCWPTAIQHTTRKWAFVGCCCVCFCGYSSLHSMVMCRGVRFVPLLPMP
jgi:hypothetical protein